MRDRSDTFASTDIAQVVKIWEQIGQSEKIVAAVAIAAAALEKRDRSEQTMQLFVAVYGAEAGLTLKLPYGGLYVADSIAA